MDLLIAGSRGGLFSRGYCGWVHEGEMKISINLVIGNIYESLL